MGSWQRLAAALIPRLGPRPRPPQSRRAPPSSAPATSPADRRLRRTASAWLEPRRQPRRLWRARLHDGGEVGRQAEAPDRQPRPRRPRRRPRERGQPRARPAPRPRAPTASTPAPSALRAARCARRSGSPGATGRSSASLVVVGVGKDDALVRQPAGRRAHPRAPHPRPVGMGRAAGPRCRPRRPRRRVDGPFRRSRSPSPRCPACACRRARRARSRRARSPSSWVLANYGRLTPGVRQAFDKAVRRAFGLSRDVPAAGGQLNAVKDQAVAFVGDPAGVQVTIPISVVRGYPSTARGAGRYGRRCGRELSLRQARGALHYQRPCAGVSKTVIAHEVFHCVQVQLPVAPTAWGRSTPAARGWGRVAPPTRAACSRRTALRRTARPMRPTSSSR